MRDLEQNILSAEEEKELQFSYIEKTKELIQKKEQEKGRKLTYNVKTFGCPTV